MQSLRAADSGTNDRDLIVSGHAAARSDRRRHCALSSIDRNITPAALYRA